MTKSYLQNCLLINTLDTISRSDKNISSMSRTLKEPFLLGLTIPLGYIVNPNQNGRFEIILSLQSSVFQVLEAFAWIFLNERSKALIIRENPRDPLSARSLQRHPYHPKQLGYYVCKYNYNTGNTFLIHCLNFTNPATHEKTD